MRLLCSPCSVQLPDVPARHRPRHFVAVLSAGAVYEKPDDVLLPTVGAAGFDGATTLARVVAVALGE